MFSSIKNFVWRHKRKFIVTGFAIGGTVVALRYAQRKIVEFHQKQAQEFMERAQRAQHFEATERTCNQTIMSFASTMCQELLKRLDAEPILAQLRKNNPENKRELWEELKILAFTRLTTLVYACSMLVVAMRIQLNLLGGYMYKDTTTRDAKVKIDVQQNYLSLAQHFLQHGLTALSELIESKVRQILSSYDLKQQISLAETEQIFWSIQMAVNSDAKDPNSSLAMYVFPMEILNGCEVLRKMHSETLDIFETDETSALCTDNVSRGFSVIMDNIADFFDLEPSSSFNANHSTTSFSNLAEPQISSVNGAMVPQSKEDLNVEKNIGNINNIRLPLAKLIPIINGLASKEFGCDARPPSISTSLITLYMISEKIKILGANIYEVFCQ